MKDISNLNIVTWFTTIFLENIVQKKTILCPQNFSRKTLIIVSQLA